MTSLKRIGAWVLTLAMLLSMMAVSGTSVLAIDGGGLQGSTSNVAYGCDLSSWNVDGTTCDYSLVDFSKMLADGCEFAILRIGYEGSVSRTNAMDAAFVEYYNRARAAGMPLGLYFYSLATTYDGAVEDAQWVISKIEQYGMYFEYPIYYDVEDSNQTSLGSTAMNNLCRGWCETLEAAGYFPGVYGGMSQVITKLTDTFKATYDVWYPAVLTNGHGSQYSPTTRNYSDRCSMWQYAWYDYEYDGIGLDMLDVNVAYKDYPTIMSTYGYNNVSGVGSTATALGTYQVNTDSLNVRAGASTSYDILDVLSNGDIVKVTELSGNWGKITLDDGTEGWCSIVNYGNYIGVDALAYNVSANSDGVTYTYDSEGSLILTNTSADQGQFDLYTPFDIGTITTPYMSLQITPISGSGYYFGITQTASGYFMMRDCMSGDELVNETSASYMTNKETLEINVKEWWTPEENYRINQVRLYIAPNSAIKVNYFYFAAIEDKVNDTTYNLNRTVDLSNVTLMQPDTLSIADRSKAGSYTYNNGMLTVTADTDAGFDVVFNISETFDVATLTRFLVDIEAHTPFNITMTVTNSQGDGTVSLVSDFYPSFMSSPPTDGFIPAWTGTAGLDLYNYYAYNGIVPSDGQSTIKQVKISLGGKGTSYFNAIQIAQNDTLAIFNDGCTKSDSSDGTDKVIFNTDYTLADGVLGAVDAGVTVSELLSNITSDYTVTVYDNGEEADASATLKTGMSVSATSDGTLLVSYDIAVLGDANCDGAVSTADVRAVLMWVVDATDVSGSQKTAADVTLDASVNTTDARAILRMTLAQ